AMWGEDVPASARKVVQNHVLALRRSLGTGMIETRPGGYVLMVARGEIDAQRFEALTLDARAASRVGHTAAAIDRFDEALRLWRGEPYRDLGDWSFARGEIARLLELCRTVVEDRLDALLAQGEHLDAVAEIEASVADAPLRERRWQLLMTALYRSGRHAEALRAFQRARDLMITQLGIEPSEALRRLEAAILAQDPALDWRGALSAPWLTVPTGSPTNASEDALRAGDVAFRRGAPAEAAACYRRALTSAGADGGSLVRECEVLVRLAESEYLAGDPARRSTGVAAARLADHLGDRGMLVRAALAGSRQIDAATTRLDSERVALLRRALEAASTPSDHARVLAVLASELVASPDYTERRKLSDTALGLARASGDAVTLHQVLAARFSTIQAPDTLDERLSNTFEDRAVVAGLDDLRSRWGALSNRSMACLEAGDDAESEQSDVAAAEIADRLGNAGARWRAQYTRARQLTWHGDLPSAKRQARSALETGRAAGEEADSLFGGQLHLILWNEGRLTEIGGVLASMPLELPLVRAFACHAYAHLRQPRHAERLLVGLAARDFSDVPYNGFWLTVMSLVADAAVRAGPPKIVDELHELLSPWHNQLVVTPATCLGSVAHYIGMLATRLDRPGNADDAFAQATDIHERMNAPVWTARTRLEWGRSLITRDHERGLVQLSLASNAALALGAHDIVAEAAALARS
ncbi:MAG: BTAD domain-containing putative transcriptional regulator, partial [Acidimicrobiales bacterium]